MEYLVNVAAGRNLGFTDLVMLVVALYVQADLPIGGIGSNLERGQPKGLQHFVKMNFFVYHLW